MGKNEPIILITCRLLLNAQRTASLRHDIETLATLINLILRLHLLTSSYGSASTFLSKVTYPDSSLISSTTNGATTSGATSASTAATNANTMTTTTTSTTINNSTTRLLSSSTSSPTQLARYLYYVGRIRAIELSYTTAHNHLLQAVRRAPRAEQAPGFWQEVRYYNSNSHSPPFFSNIHVWYVGSQMACRRWIVNGRYTRTQHIPSSGFTKSLRRILWNRQRFVYSCRPYYNTVHALNNLVSLSLSLS